MQASIACTFAVLCACICTAGAYSDSDILNFALNLECLEAEFYSWAAFGTGLTETQRGGGPEAVGGMKANLTDYQAIAEEIAINEIQHVEFLRTALGDAAVPCPLIDIGAAFSAAADAALGTTLSPPFNVYQDQLTFLIGALLFEDTGVSAYNGALGVIRDPAVSAAARSIMAVEAYHGGAIRLFLAEDADELVEPYGVPVSAITLAASAALDSLLKLKRNQPVGSFAVAPTIAPVDSNSLAFAVSPEQVLNVVYLSTVNRKGGFFPNGVNGLLGATRGALTDICNGDKKALRYDQCGGTNWDGPTCCVKFNTCVAKNAFYSQCEPTGIPSTLVRWFRQCGGQGYTGPTQCEPRSRCKKINEFYSQCRPRMRE